MQLKEFVLSARRSLSEIYAPEEANTIAGVLCTEYLGVESYTYMVNPGYEIKDKDLAVANVALERLMANEPLQYVLGYTTFYGQKFKVNPNVLIPRPETELICRHAIEDAMMLYRKRSAYGSQAEPIRILDLCTGSGCIAWTMAQNVPGSEVVAIDISPEALEVAKAQNITKEKSRTPKFYQADIFDDEAMDLALGKDATFDIIISNPPYVLESEKPLMRKNVLDFEPALALFVPDDDAMKFNKKIACTAFTRLSTEGVGFVEINEALGEPTGLVFAESGFKRTEIFKDFSHKPRFLKFGR